jgi:transposase InsO family protein
MASGSASNSQPMQLGDLSTSVTGEFGGAAFQQQNARIKFDTFSGRDEDWPKWSARFRAHMKPMGLQQILVGEITRPENAGALQRDFDLKNSLIFSHLIACCDGEAFACVSDVKDDNGAQAWKELERIYRSASETRRTNLRTELFNMEKRSHKSSEVKEFINQVMKIKTELAEIGERIDETQVIAVIEGGLSEEYIPLIAALKQRENKLDLKSEINEIRHFTDYVLSINKKRDREEPTTAMLASTPAKRPFKGKCDNCGRNGHMKKTCFRPGGGAHDPARWRGETKKDWKPSETKSDSVETKANKLDLAYTVELVLEEAHMCETAKHTQEWVIDSGATLCMTPHKEDFTEIDYSHSGKVRIANGETISAKGIGKVTLELTTQENDKIEAEMNSVLWVPELGKRLFSVKSSNKKGIKVQFENDNQSYLMCKNGIKIPFYETASVFVLPSKVVKQTIQCEAHFAQSTEPEMVIDELWHRRLGHASYSKIIETVRQKVVTGIPTNKRKRQQQNEFCGICTEGKAHRQAIPKVNDKRATQVGEVVFSDIEEMEQESIAGFKYMISFIDDYSRMKFIVPIKQKSDALNGLQQIIATEFNTDSKRIQRLHSDNGGEYISKEFREYCTQNKIQQTFSAPRTPEQNGVAERAWRSIVEMMRCMLFQAGLGKSFWVLAANAAVHVLNRLGTKANNQQTPYERWHNTAPDLSHLRVFGCAVHVLNELHKQKLEPRTWEGIFVGYDRHDSTYLVWDKAQRSVRKTRNVTFDESSFTYSSAKPNRTASSNANKQERNISTVELSHQIAETRTQQRNTTHQAENSTGIADPMEWEHEFNHNTNEPQSDTEYSSAESDNEGPNRVHSQLQSNFGHGTYWTSSSTHKTARGRAGRSCHSDYSTHALMALAEELMSVEEPQTYKAAIESVHSKEWEHAMKSELQSLEHMGTWELVPKPENRDIVKGKWVFKVKRNSDGTIKKFKARYVAKGYSQTHGVDYWDTFAPVARNSTLRTVLAVAAQKDWHLEHSDVSNAYVNSSFEKDGEGEEIFMQQPEGAEVIGPNGQKLVCKLKKGLYGLKQSGRMWNQNIRKKLLSLGFAQSFADPCLYTLKQSEKMLIVVLFVDDMILAGDKDMMNQFKTDISKAFDMVHEGQLTWLLGMKVQRKDNGDIVLSQEAYIHNILKRFGFEHCNPVSTPGEGDLTKEMSPTTQQGRDDMKKYPIRQVIGSCAYAAVSTRPDIQEITNRVSRFVSDPGNEHWTAAIRILKYLQGTQNLGLLFKNTKTGKCILSGYCDSNYGGCKDTFRSTTAYIFKVNGAPVSWCSKLQNSVAKSTCEAEYVSTSTAAQEAVHLRNVLKDLGQEQVEPTTVYCDNRGAIQLANNTVTKTRSKHIDIQIHFVRELVERNVVQFKYIPSKFNVADMFTKPLGRNKLETHRNSIMIEV